MTGKRKVIITLACGGMIFLGFILAGILKISEGLFIAYIGGITGLAGLYAEGNLRSKKITNGGGK
ncbi:MAG: hypothetical protein AMS17_12865 [Spirochaetes bacterium DG_61]|nr:MAG: hypothetical protein AMS17_12865 [Spirochaetes bacterium DG_61]